MKDNWVKPEYCIYDISCEKCSYYKVSKVGNRDIGNCIFLSDEKLQTYLKENIKKIRGDKND